MNNEFNKTTIWSNNNIKEKKLYLNPIKTQQDIVHNFKAVKNHMADIQNAISTLQDSNIPNIEEKIKDLETNLLSSLIKRVENLEKFMLKDIKKDLDITMQAKALVERMEQKESNNRFAKMRN